MSTKVMEDGFAGPVGSESPGCLGHVAGPLQRQMLAAESKADEVREKYLCSEEFTRALTMAVASATREAAVKATEHAASKVEAALSRGLA